MSIRMPSSIPTEEPSKDPIEVTREFLSDNPSTTPIYMPKRSKNGSNIIYKIHNKY